MHLFNLLVNLVEHLYVICTVPNICVLLIILSPQLASTAHVLCRKDFPPVPTWLLCMLPAKKMSSCCLSLRPVIRMNEWVVPWEDWKTGFSCLLED